MSQVQTVLGELIEAKTGVRPQPENTLDVLLIDSLAMAELTVEIEAAFGIRIDDDVLDVERFSELVEYVRRKASECAGSSDA